MTALVYYGRSARRLAILLSAAGAALAEYGACRLVRGKPTHRERAQWLHRWCRRTLPYLGVSVTGTFAPPSAGLLVANHLSYLDILAIAALQPAIFVAKKEVAGWPLFGLLTRLSGSVFVDRTRAADIPRVNHEIGRRLSEGLLVVIFPEGTSSDGSGVLHFRSPLLQPAIGAKAPITAARIGYRVEGGRAETDACYWGDMIFFPHLVRLLGQRCVEAALRFGHPRRFANRRYAAFALREQISVMRVPVGEATQADAAAARATSLVFTS